MTDFLQGLLLPTPLLNRVKNWIIMSYFFCSWYLSYISYNYNGLQYFWSALSPSPVMDLREVSPVCNTGWQIQWWLKSTKQQETYVYTVEEYLASIIMFYLIVVCHVVHYSKSYIFKLTRFRFCEVVKVGPVGYPN